MSQCTLESTLDTISAIEQRRSIKHFDPATIMTEAEIEQLLSLTLLSPTSFNIQNWRFVVVDNAETKQALRAAAWNQAQVSEASIVVLVCADLKSWDKAPERYWQNAPQAVQDMLVPMIRKFYSESAELEHDEALRSVGIASQTLMLAAKALGFDSCPMIGFDSKKVGEIIGLPADHLVGLMIPVGKALQPARERGGQLPYAEVVFRNRFPQG